MAGLNQEIWTEVLVEDFRATEEASFLNEITDSSHLVTAGRGDNDVIHLVDVGVDPDVLINNTTYPIAIMDQNDADIPIGLDKYQTKATRVTDDEIQHIAYDKIKLVQRKHKNAIMKTKHAKAAHALAPAGDTADTPVLMTTGADDGTGRKMLVKADLLRLKRKWDALGIPLDGRILVLSAEHFSDLLEQDNKFADQFSNESSGKLNKFLSGFKLYTYLQCPYYTRSTKVKISFGAVPTALESQASVAFYKDDMFKASGRTKNYTDEPTTTMQQWLYNVRHNYIVLPRKVRGIAAIVSDAV